jgi:hypothetical protein
MIYRISSSRKRIICFLPLLFLWVGCAKIEFQDRLYKDFEDFNRTIKNLPEEMQRNLNKNIVQMETSSKRLMDEAEGVGSRLTKELTKGVEGTLNNTLKTAGSEVEKLSILANDIAKERMQDASNIVGKHINQADAITEKHVKQVDTIIGKHVKQVDEMRAKSLNKTDSILQNAISRTDTMLKNTIEHMDLSTERKILLINDVARKDAKSFRLHLDTFSTAKAYLANKIIEQRINQVFNRLDGTIKSSISQLDNVLGKNIHLTYFMGNIVAENIIQAAQHSTAILSSCLPKVFL